MSHPETVPVEQVDREAAAKVRPNSHNSALILAGERDGTDIVQAAAHARIAALQAAAERERVLIESAWNDGFNCARNCLRDDDAFELTEDVQHDAWLDSDTRAATPGESA